MVRAENIWYTAAITQQERRKINRQKGTAYMGFLELAANRLSERSFGETPLEEEKLHLNQSVKVQR